MTDHKHQRDKTFWLGFLAQTIHHALKLKRPEEAQAVLEHNLGLFTESAGCPPSLRKGLK